MSGRVYRRLLVVIVVLGLVAGLWLLPKGFSVGSTVPPPPIELRSTQPVAPTASPTPAVPSVVDDEDATDDDGADDRDDRDADQPTSRRADPRGHRADAPATGRVGDDAVDDDDDDEGPDDDGDDDDKDEDDD